MAKEYKRVLTRTCDFCSEKIDGDSVKVIREPVTVNGRKLGVEIRPVSGEEGVRFTADICGRCLCEAAAAAGGYPRDPGVKGPFTEKVIDEGNEQGVVEV